MLRDDRRRVSVLNHQHPILQKACLPIAIAAGVVAMAAVSRPASAAAIYWDGTGTSWNDTGSWSTASATTTPDPATVPGSGDDVTFNISGLNTAQVVSLDAAQAANSLTITNTAATTLQGGSGNQTLTLGAGGVTINAGAGASTIGSATAGQNVAVAVGASQTWTNNASTAFTVVNGVSGTAGTGGSQSLTVDGTGASTVSGAISNGTGGGTLSLTKNGTGTLTLSGANSFSGGTTLNAGVLLVQGSSTVSAGSITAGPLGTGALTLNGGTFGFGTGGSYNVANNVSVSGAAKIQVASGTNEVLSGNWSGSASLTLVANGTTGQWQFAGDNSGYTGTFTQNGGNTSLAFNNAAAGSAAAAWNFNNGTNQRTRLNFGNGTINFGSLAGNGSIANVAGSGLSTMSVGALNTNTTFTGLIGGTPINNQPQGQNIAVVKVGTGSLTLTAANPYTSTTTVENGALIAGGNVASGAASPLGNASSAVALGDAATISSNTAMHPQLLVGGAFTLARAITVGADNSALGNSATNFTLGGSTANTSTVSGPITLNQDLSVTQVSGGTLNLTSNITSGASGTQTITFDNAGAVSQSVGTIGGGTGTIALKKINSGTLTLAGANSYSGTTTVQSGTLALTGGSSNNIASSPKILIGDTQANSAANLDVTGLSGGGITLASNQTLAGYGTVIGNVAGVSASTVAPGDVAANGVLNVAGNFALGAGTFDVQLNKTAADAAGGAQVAGTDFDQLVVSGSGSTVSVSGGNLALTLGNNLVNGDVFTILDNQGSSAIDGIFSGATVNGMAATGSFNNGGTFSADVGGTNYSFLIRYDAGTGNDVALTVAVPEPGALAAMCGLGMAGLMRRRRRSAESV